MVAARPLGLIASLAVCPVGALGQTEPLLSGPKVEESRLPGIEETLTDTQTRMQGMGAEAVPSGVFRRAIESLRGQEAPEEVRLSQDQEDEIAALQRDHARALRAYLAEHQDKIDELRRAARNIERQADPNQRRSNDRPERARRPESSEPMSDRASDPREIRRQIQALRQGGPQETDVQTRIWGVLAEAQRDAVEEQIDAYRAQLEKRRQERSMRRFMESRRSQNPASTTTTLDPDLAQFERSLPERLRQRLRNLEPEQRVRLLERLQSRSGQ